MKKKLFCYYFFIFIIILSSITKVSASEQIKFVDNYRVYEPINVSNIKGLDISSENNIDFSKADVKADVLNGMFSGNYKIKSLDESKNVKLGFIITSNLNDLDKFSLKSGGENLNYNIKFLSDKFLQPTGDEFYKEVLKGVSGSSYIPVNFKSDSTGLLRVFNLQSTDSEKLSYEITVTYDGEKSKVFANGGKSINVEVDKNKKVMKILHELGGNYKNPNLFVIGDNVVVNTKVLANGKEISTGFTEKIDRSNVPVIEYMKNTFLSNLPESIKGRLTDANVFELFAENFDKILGGVSQDSVGLLNTKSAKLIFVTAELPVDKNEKALEVRYPISAGVTTINDTKVMKLNMEVSSMDTFEKFHGINYNVLGNEEYKYVVSSTVDYKTTETGSTIPVKDTSSKLISNLMFKESYLRGISKLQPNKYTSLVIILVGLVEIIGVIYLRGVYKSKYSRKSSF